MKCGVVWCVVWCVVCDVCVRVCLCCEDVCLRVSCGCAVCVCGVHSMVKMRVTVSFATQTRSVWNQQGCTGRKSSSFCGCSKRRLILLSVFASRSVSCSGLGGSLHALKNAWMAVKSWRSGEVWLCLLATLPFFCVSQMCFATTGMFNVASRSVRKKTTCYVINRSTFSTLRR